MVVVRFALLLSLAAVVAGFVWIYTVGSLFGALLVLGGVMSLGVTMIPAAIDSIATFLSTGSLRGRWWK